MQIYETAETNTQKQELFQQFNSYLAQRAKNLDKQGGKDSLIYARERAIVLNIINQYGLSNGNVAEATAKPKAMNTKLEQEVEMPQATPAATATVNAPASSGGNVEELTKLMDMFQAGLLTKEEFQAAKAKLLGL